MKFQVQTKSNTPTPPPIDDEPPCEEPILREHLARIEDLVGQLVGEIAMLHRDYKYALKIHGQEQQ